ncbi:tetratricopeptide repeat protein [Microcoleus sp. B5-D4]|uniref:tetratricopeptide repeat protein n=1 Tax=unclassified Microcoleus TaxID=2642155 RepID=UPI002FD6812F
MKSDFAEFDFKSQNSLEVDITPPGEWMLANLGIDLAAPEFREMPPCKRAQYRAVKNWLTRYKLKPDASNLEKVRGYLEAFHHLCEVEDWQRAWETLVIRLNTPIKEQLHNQFGIWGYYREQIEIYDRILGKLNQTENTILFNVFANAYQALGDHETARKYYQQSLNSVMEFPNRKLEATVLGNIANTYLSQRKFSKALKCYQ